MAAKQRRLELVSRRKNARLTQEQLAERLNVDVRTIRSWESGDHTPSLWMRSKLARVLQVSLHELEEMLWEDRAAQVEDNQAEEMFSALNADEHAHVLRAIAEPRRFLDDAVITAFARQLDALIHSDGALGPMKTLPGVLGLLEIIERSATDVSPALRRRLLSLGARGAEFAGWLCRDLLDRPRAVAWYNQATEWAQEACDLPMQGYVLLKKSQMAYDQRDSLRLVTLASAAHEGPWQLPFKVKAEVTQQVARGLAMRGEPLPVVQRHLDEAQVWLGRATDAPSESPLSSHYNQSSLTLQTASCYIEAGRPRMAIELYDQTLRTPDLSRRDQGYFLARNAVALALAGEPDDAAQRGLEAVEIALSTNSQRTTGELRRALQTLEPWSGRPGPRELRDAVGV